MVPVAQQRTTLSIKPKTNKKKNKGNNKKGVARQKSPLSKKKSSKAFQTVRSKKNKQTGYLPRITSDGEAPLPQALLKKLDDVVQNDTPTIVIKDSPTNIDSSTEIYSPVEETPESSGTTTPTAPTPGKKPRKLKKKQPVKFSLDTSLVSVLKAIEAPFPYKEEGEQQQQQDQQQDQDEDEEYHPLLLQLTMEQSVHSTSSPHSSPSFAASSSSPAMVPRKRTNKPREQKRQFPREQ